MSWVKVLLSLLFLFLLFSCERTNSLIIPSDEEDLLSLVGKENGIVLEFEGIQEHYSFGDTIKGTFRISNQSDSTVIPIYSRQGPLAKFKIFDGSYNHLGTIPDFSTRTVYDFDLNPQQSLEYPFTWAQIEPTSNFQVFSGQYLIKPSFVGSSLLNDPRFGVSIRIMDSGNPISMKAYYHYSDPDTFRVDLAIRNRGNKKISLAVDPSSTVLVEMFDFATSRVVWSDSRSLGLGEIEISSKQASHIYTYAVSHQYLKNEGLEGPYILKLSLNFLNPAISAETNVLVK